MKVFVLGGDGFCGWPIALHLSARGDDVTIVDNLSRRRLDRELAVGSLTPLAPLNERLTAWREVGGHEIQHANIDLARDYDGFVDLLRAERPDAVVHLAEQRSVPYSMGSTPRRRYTFENNLNATHNVLVALVDSGVDAHLVHMGSTGIYGYESIGYQLPEGYVEAEFQSKKTEILHPANPLSIYHLTKAQDQLALAFFSKHEGLRTTDLVQGAVWGTQTDQTARDKRLINRFDYDDVYGTVLNRFILQAALGHPLTVYGRGEQTRAFIHISDVVRCVTIALDNPAVRGERMRVFNQIGESRRVIDLARLVANVWPGVTISNLDNPRQEPAANDLDLSNESLRALGLTPKLIADGVLAEIRDIAAPYAHRANRAKIDPPSQTALAGGHQANELLSVFSGVKKKVGP